MVSGYVITSEPPGALVAGTEPAGAGAEVGFNATSVTEGQIGRKSFFADYSRAEFDGLRRTGFCKADGGGCGC